VRVIAAVKLIARRVLNKVRFAFHPEPAVAAARRFDPDGLTLARTIRARRLTFLQLSPLLDLRKRARELDDRAVPGIFLEAGCALGGSAILLTASKHRERRLQVYDVFGLIPPPSDRDGEDVQHRYDRIRSGEAEGLGGDVYYGYQSDLLQTVRSTFEELGYPCESNNVTLIEGLFEDTLRLDGPVALAHIDGDWYESVKVCLDRIWPELSIGGVMIIDDYDDWSGCRTAVDEFLADHPQCEVERRSRLHLVRAPANAAHLEN